MNKPGFAAPRPLVSFSLLAGVLGCTGCGSTATQGSADTLPDAAPPDAPTQPRDAAGPADAKPETSPPPDAAPDGPFQEGLHAYTTIPTSGGPVLAQPTLVTITYADDPHRAFAEGIGAYLVQSPWLTAVGSEYGVGLGTHVSVELTDNAPTAIDDTGVQALIASLIAAGTAPAPSGGTVVPTWTAPWVGDAGAGDDGGSLDAGDAGDAGTATATLIPAVYMLYVPASTTETVDGMKLCDWTGGGYHSQAQGSFHGQTFPYAVVTQCSAMGQDELEQAVSHEFIEACTDPSVGARAYKMTDPSNVWTALGGEVGDLCSLVEPQWSEGGYTSLQRVYSNASAKAGGDPCPPSNGPYYATDVEPHTFIPVQPGQSVKFNVAGWSTAAMPSWQLYATPYVSMPMTFMPVAAVDAKTMNNGGMATLTVTVPTAAASQSYAILGVGSATSQTNYGYSVVGVYVP